jgi:dihydroorotate dehydrogenase electron transfer subunit
VNPVSAEVWENKEICPGVFRLKLRPYGPVPAVAPGRFFMLSVARGLDPLLRRPLGHLCNSTDDNGIHLMEFLYEVRGRGTRSLSLLQPPHIINYLGPLGHGWQLNPMPSNIIMVAGGMGVVPLYSAVRAIFLAKPRPRVTFLYGARSRRGLVLARELETMTAVLKLATDDGTAGVKGLVTDLLEPELKSARPALILACGPRPMLRATARMAKSAGAECQVSLEARMGCGLGACLTCSLAAADGRRLRVCQEGPVFPADLVDWKALDDLP